MESFLEEDPAGINPYSIKNYHNEFVSAVLDLHFSVMSLKFSTCAAFYDFESLCI